jgi:hypothetical protein
VATAQGEFQWAAKFDRIAQEEIELELMALALQIEGTIKSLAPVGVTGLMRGSFMSDVQRVPGGIAIEVGTPVEYGPYVEFGTKPHWAPIDPLKRWVERKIQPHVLAVGVSFESGKAVPTRKGTRVLRGDARQRAVMSVAYAVQKAIARRGTKGQFIMAETMRELGLGYEVRQTDTERYYEINLVTYLERNGRLWEKILQRIAAESQPTNAEGSPS